MECVFLSVHSHGPIYYSFHSLSYSISYFLAQIRDQQARYTMNSQIYLSVDTRMILQGICLGWSCSSWHLVRCYALRLWLQKCWCYTKQIFACCGAVLTHHQGSPSSSTPPKSRRLGVYLYCLCLLVL